MVREILRTGGKILSYIVENKSPGLSPNDIVSKRLTESMQNLIDNLRFRELSRAAEENKICEKVQSNTCNKKGNFLLIYFIQPSTCPVPTKRSSTANSTFFHTSVLGTVGPCINSSHPCCHNDLEFFILSHSDTYLDLDIKHYVRGKFVSGSVNDVDLTDTTVVISNLPTPCSVSVTSPSTALASRSRASRRIIFPLLRPS